MKEVSDVSHRNPTEVARRGKGEGGREEDRVCCWGDWATCNGQICTKSVHCNVSICLCLLVLFILCTACRRLTIGLAAPL